jgi:Zn-dependent peptidase ImmA (M78 family)/transcriptional regulator with XRE-family HTH domain
MAERLEAHVKPKVLIWARESIGLSRADVSQKLKAKDNRVEEWEGGRRNPTFPQLRRLAEIYKRPLAAFFLEVPPTEAIGVHDFRRGTAKRPSPELLVEMRLARRRRELALQLSRDVTAVGRRFALDAALTESSETVGQRLRQLTGISLDDQRRLRSHSSPLNVWINALEGAGVLVFQTSRVALDEMRGFSIFAVEYPVIMLNGKDSPRARAFTLFHELAHLSLHREGLCDLRESRRATSADQRLESFCNASAASALIPRSALMEFGQVRDANANTEWGDDELQRLSDIFWVSREATLRRLLTLERTSSAFYERKRRQFMAEYEELRKKARGGGPPYHQMVVRNNGPAFTRLVVDAHRRNDITPIELADYLGASLKHLSDIERDVETVRR